MGINRSMDGDFLVLEVPESGERTRIQEMITGDEALIAPDGRLTMEMVHDLEDELTSMVLMCRSVTIDMTKVRYISNSVLKMMLDIQHVVDSRKGSLKIRGAEGDIWKKFEEMGLEDVFDIDRPKSVVQ